MALPRHTPYDGSSIPFTIGLRPIDPDDWFEVDDHLVAQLEEKGSLFEDRFDVVFQAEPDTIASQQEVLERLLDYLPRMYGDIYRTTPQTVTIVPAEKTYTIDDHSSRPLELAARLVQDDLVLMRKGSDGHRLVAAALCFPSSWSLSQKFGRPLADIHRPVPGFGRGTRTAEMIERIFSNLKSDQLVERFNWSLYDDPRLHFPQYAHTERGLRDEAGKIRAWLRIERQTLSKLPIQGDILFTIKICVDPLETLRHHAEGAVLAGAMRRQIERLDDDQLDYKGLSNVREDICRELRMIECKKS